MMKIKRSKFNLLIILILTFQLLYPFCSMYYKYGDQNKNAKPQIKPASASGGGYDMFNDNYSWIEIKDSGIRLSISNYDDSYDVINLISWNFEFYKKNFSSIYVSSNGWVSLTNLGDIAWLPGFIPSYDIENYGCIALLAEDLDPSYGGDIYYEFFGTSPNRYLVIEYYHVYDYYNLQFIGDFEVILKENGDVTFQYKNVNNLDYFYPLIGIDYGDLANYNRFDPNLPISNLAITFKFNEMTSGSWEVNVDVNDEYVWKVNKVNNTAMQTTFGNNWEDDFGFLLGFNNDDKIKIKIKSIMDNSTHKIITYDIWDWVEDGADFDLHPNKSESIAFLLKLSESNESSLLPHLIPFFMPTPIIPYLLRSNLSNIYYYLTYYNWAPIELLFDSVNDSSIYGYAEYNLEGILHYFDIMWSDDYASEIIFQFFVYLEENNLKIKTIPGFDFFHLVFFTIVALIGVVTYMKVKST